MSAYPGKSGMAPQILMTLLLLVTVCPGEEGISTRSAEPFISGFDRFGKHGELDPVLARGLLLTELNCTACHTTANAASASILAPKLGPDLSGVGARRSQDWMTSLLLHPKEVQPAGTMPDLLHGLSDSEKKQIAASLAAFLSTLQIPFPELKATGLIPVTHEFWLKGNVENGAKLYHSVGCVACHAPEADYAAKEIQASSLDKLLEQLDPEELEELGLSGAARAVQSVPHGALEKKFTLLSLTHFLHNPQRTHPSGRMPNLKLLPAEAADLAAYLLRNQESPPSLFEADTNSRLVEQGKTHFVELGCVNCHSFPGLTNSKASLPFEKLNWNAEHTCINHSRIGQPVYGLSETQKQALASQPATPNAAYEFPEHILRMLQLNCFACHEREKLGGVGRHRQQYFETVGHVDIGDEGRLPPSLTHVGKKLTSPWFGKVLNGTGDIRPHMTIRMPVFPATLTKDLPRQLARTDEGSNRTEAEVLGGSGELALAGRELLNTGCIQCHPVRGESLSSVVGTDLSGVSQRVRPEWFKEFLLNPIDLKTRTRMPTFFPNGVSSNKEILQGAVDQQIAAIWTYLKEVEKHPLPEKILEERSKNFELTPTDRPVVLRTFMKRAGTHAIAVGFPEHMNYAFDAETCRMVEAWKGKFLDAHGTWYDRFTPVAEPLGTASRELFSFLEFEQSDGKDTPDSETGIKRVEPRFLGYRLDSQGIPSFKYDFAGRMIEDRMIPEMGGGFRRTIVITLSEASPLSQLPLRILLLQGKRIEQHSSERFVNDTGMTLSLPANGPLKVELAQNKTEMYCFSLIPQQHHIVIEVTYQW